MTFEIDPQGVKDLEALMELVATGASRPARLLAGVLRDAGDRDQPGRHLRAVQAIATVRVAVVGLQRLPLSHRQDYFVNSQHLNAKGAALFSRQFADTSPICSRRR